jgi:hypothetical protein
MPDGPPEGVELCPWNAAAAAAEKAAVRANDAATVTRVILDTELNPAARALFTFRFPARTPAGTDDPRAPLEESLMGRVLQLKIRGACGIGLMTV